MAKLQVITQQVTISSLSGQSGGKQTELSAYLAVPPTAGRFPGIIVLQEIFGVNTYVRAVTERIASLGYVAIAPALFDRVASALRNRQAPGFDVGYAMADVELGRTYAQNTTAPELLADIQGAIDQLKMLPQVQPNFGCVGFCFGGHVAYLAATLADIAVTAAFYGAGITTYTPGGGEPSVSRTGAIGGKIDLFFGMDDTSIPPAHIAEIDTALTTAQIPHQIWQYPGAEHGFACDLRSSYNPTAAADAWLHVEELFQQLNH